MIWTIYGLRFHKEGHPSDGKIRYVGQTTETPRRRLQKHCAHAKFASKNSKPSAILRAILKHGPDCFTAEELATADNRLEADAIERALIKNLGTSASSCNRGLNIAPGGEGVDYTDPVVRARHKASLNDEWRRKQRARNINSNPEFRKAHAEAMARPEVRSTRSRVMSEVRNRPEVAEALSRRVTERNKTPEARAITAERNRSPEMRASSRKRAEALNSNPSAKLRMTIKRNEQSLALWMERGDAEKAEAARRRIATAETKLAEL